MKTFNKIIFALAALSLLAVSCVKSEPTQQATALSTSIAEIINLPSSKAPDKDVYIDCDGYWIVQAPSWITVSPTYGTGNGKVTLKFEDNLDELGNQKIPRNGDVVVVAGEKLSKTISVKQTGDRTLLIKKLPYEVNFKTSQDLFTIENKSLEEGLSGVWSQGSKYGMRGTAYSGGNKTSESWLVSPEINLTSAKAAILSFNQTYNYVSAKEVAGYFKLAVTSDGGESWLFVDKEKINYGTGAWAEVNSGNIDLSEYRGNVVQFAFVYTSDASNAGTWEIFDLKFVEEVPASIALDKTSVQAAAAGDSFKLNVTSASTVWTLSSNVDWITMDPTTGTGNAEIAVTVAAGDPAEGKITLSAEGLDPVECTVNRVDYVTKTIAEVCATAKDETVKTKGAISAISNKGYVITDATGSILVYSNALTEYAVGDTVSVVGTKGEYNSGPQINSPTKQEKVSSAEIKYPDAKLIDATEAANIKLTVENGEIITMKYVKIVGTLSVSGNNINVTIADSDMQGSVYQATDAQKTTASGLSGKTVELYGMVSSVSKSGNPKVPKYINVVMTSAEEFSETVEHALANKGKSVSVVGQVSAISKKGYVLSDDTGSIFVYTQSLTTYQIGTKLRVTGKSDTYNSGPQIGSTITESLIETGSIDYGTPKLIDATEAANIKLTVENGEIITMTYVKIVGTLSVSGNNVNVTIADSDMQGSVYQATDDQKTTASGLSGKTVELYGYLQSVSKSGNPKVPKYINVVMTSVVEVKE